MAFFDDNLLPSNESDNNENDILKILLQAIFGGQEDSADVGSKTSSLPTPVLPVGSGRRVLPAIQTPGGGGAGGSKGGIGDLLGGLFGGGKGKGKKDKDTNETGALIGGIIGNILFPGFGGAIGSSIGGSI